MSARHAPDPHEVAELRTLAAELETRISDLIVDQRGDVPPALDDAANAAEELGRLLREAVKEW